MDTAQSSRASKQVLNMEVKLLKPNKIPSSPGHQSKFSTWSWEQDSCLEMGILYGFRSLTCKKTGNMLYNNPKWGGEGKSLLCNSLSGPDAMYVIELKASSFTSPHI